MADSKPDDKIAPWFDEYYTKKNPTKIITHCTGGTGRTAWLLGAFMIKHFYTNFKTSFMKEYNTQKDDKLRVQIISADHDNHELHDLVKSIDPITMMVTWKMFKDSKFSAE